MEKADVNDMELDSAGKQTMETLKAGERIIEALDLADEEKQGWEAYEAVSWALLWSHLFIANRCTYHSIGKGKGYASTTSSKESHLDCYG